MEISVIPRAKQIFMGIVLMVSFAITSCSDDGDKPDNRTEIEYSVILYHPENYLFEISYIGSKGEIVEIQADTDSSVKLVDNQWRWSKKIKVDVPFEAQVTARVFNEGTQTIQCAASIAKDGVVLYLNDDFIGPNITRNIPVHATITE